MEIVRKRLDADEVTPSGTRYDATADTIQVSGDGGTTWVDTPQLDPRHADNFRLPPLTGDVQCDAAERMRNWIKDYLNGVVASVGLVQTVNAILAIVTLVTGGVGFIISLILAVAEALLAIGTTAISTNMTTAVYDELLCIILSNIDADGQMSAAQLNDIRTAVNSDIGGTAATILNLVFDTIGEVGLSNAAVNRTESGDCGACITWCYEFDWTLGDQLGFAPLFFAGVDFAVWSGASWTRIYNRNDEGVSETRIVSDTLPEFTVSRIEMDVYCGDINTDYNVFIGGFTHTGDVGFTGAGTIVLNGISATGTTIRIDLAVVADVPETFYRLRLFGTGTNPFGEDNC